MRHSCGQQRGGAGGVPHEDAETPGEDGGSQSPEAPLNLFFLYYFLPSFGYYLFIFSSIYIRDY